jgi:hypothetical protein
MQQQSRHDPKQSLQVRMGTLMQFRTAVTQLRRLYEMEWLWQHRRALQAQAEHDPVVHRPEVRQMR